MEDPLKPQLNYSEALAHIKDRQHNLDLREKDVAERHEKLLKLEKAVSDTQLTAQTDIAALERQKRTLHGDVAKLTLTIENAQLAHLEQQRTKESEIAKLTLQVASLETSYNLGLGRNEELAKSLRTKEVELGAKRRELDELGRYHKEQETSVQVALNGYNDQLHASTTRLAELQQEIALAVDRLQSTQTEANLVSEQALTERLRLETELTALEEQCHDWQTQLDRTTTELDELTRQLSVAQTEYDKTIKETEEAITKSLIERKAASESRALLKKVEADAASERRRLQSDRSVYGRL